MTKPTPAEIIVPFVVCMAGIAGMTLAAARDPDNVHVPFYGGGVTLLALAVVGFYFHRARKKAT